MPKDIKYAVQGAPVFSIGDWVTNAGAGTLVDVGHTEALEEAPELEDLPFESEQAQGIPKLEPTKTGFVLTVPLLQTEAENLRKILLQATGQLTGTGDNRTLAITERVAAYFQATIATKGFGTTGSHVRTYWRLYPISIDPIPFSKGAWRKFAAKFRVCQDESITTVTTNGKFYKQVDS